MTDNQLNVLQELYNEGSIDANDKRYHRNTTNSLEKKGFIKWGLYENGPIYEITDKGIDNLPKLF